MDWLRNTRKEMSFLEHVQELRKRIIISVIVLFCAAVLCIVFYDIILSMLFRPFSEAPHLASEKGTLFVSSLFEGFSTRIKISIIAGIIISIPVHLFNIIRFIFPGLKRKEKLIIIISLIMSFILIVFSFYYGYYKIIPLSINFLTGSGFIPIKVGILLNYGKNIFYILQFLLITMILFQLPIVLELLMVVSLLKRKTLLKASRYIIVAIFILSAVLTPPDFVSQVGVAIPLIFLYFITILVAKIFRFGEG